MAIQAITNHNAAANFGYANPVQNLGRLAITMLAMHIISNLPGAEALSLCKKICEPLPGGENDAPEQICTETCEKGQEIIKTQTKEVLKEGQWKVVEVLGTVASAGVSLIDCSYVCSPGALFNHGGRLTEAGLQFMFGDKTQAVAKASLTAAKAACTAMMAIPYVGWGMCYSCCNAITFNVL